MTRNTNPYAPHVAPTLASPDDKDATWYLGRIQKYYRRIGITMLAYNGIVVVAAGAGELTNGSLHIVTIIGLLVWCALLTWLFTAMIRIGCVSHAEFPVYYNKARWIGIIAGALFFPILGLPAIVSVRRLTRYNALINAKE